MFASGDITGNRLTTAAAALAAQVAESKLFDANKSRVFDGLIGVHDVGQSSAIRRWIDTGTSAPTWSR